MCERNEIAQCQEEGVIQDKSFVKQNLLDKRPNVEKMKFNASVDYTDK